MSPAPASTPLTTSTPPVHSLTAPVADVGGPRLQFLASPLDVRSGQQQGVLRGTIPVGGFVPVHSHDDLESFLVLEGELSIYQDDGHSSGWTSVSPGDFVVIQPSVRHAWRNTGSVPAVSIIVTTGRLYEFLQAAATPCSPNDPPQPPSPEWLGKFFALSAEYGYWNGSPEENAAIGLHLG